MSTVYLAFKKDGEIVSVAKKTPVAESGAKISLWVSSEGDPEYISADQYQKFVDNQELLTEEENTGKKGV